MNVGRECEREGTESDACGRVPCRWPRCVTKSKVLIGHVRREHRSTDHPRRYSPATHVVGGQGEPSAGKEVDDADEKRRANPCLTTRCIHDAAQRGVDAAARRESTMKEQKNLKGTQPPLASNVVLCAPSITCCRLSHIARN